MHVSFYHLTKGAPVCAMGVVSTSPWMLLGALYKLTMISSSIFVSWALTVSSWHQNQLFPPHVASSNVTERKEIVCSTHLFCPKITGLICKSSLLTHTQLHISVAVYFQPSPSLKDIFSWIKSFQSIFIHLLSWLSYLACVCSVNYSPAQCDPSVVEHVVLLGFR